MQECLSLRRVIGKWRLSNGDTMIVGSKHEVEELTSGSAKIVVDIEIGDIVGDMSSGESRESCSGVGDDGGDSDKRGARSIGVGR